MIKRPPPDALGKFKGMITMIIMIIILVALGIYTLETIKIQQDNCFNECIRLYPNNSIAYQACNKAIN